MSRGRQSSEQTSVLPWVDWQNYWATGDSQLKGVRVSVRFSDRLARERTRHRGALLDLEYQRMEMIKFNLFDNSGTYQEYVLGRDGVEGPALKVWNSMRLPNGHPDYDVVGRRRPGATLPRRL